MRLQHGMSLAKQDWRAHVSAEDFTWSKDRKGKGGKSSIEPFHGPAASMPVGAQVYGCMGVWVFTCSFLKNGQDGSDKLILFRSPSNLGLFCLGALVKMGKS